MRAHRAERCSGPQSCPKELGPETHESIALNGATCPKTGAPASGQRALGCARVSHEKVPRAVKKSDSVEETGRDMRESIARNPAIGPKNERQSRGSEP